MTRLLYRCLLWLHPPGFRRQFAGEMLWIFDEAAASLGAGALLVDGVISLLRQWVIGAGTWKVAAGVMGGMVQMVIVMSLIPPTNPYFHPSAPGQLRQFASSYEWEFPHALVFVIGALVLFAAGLRRSATATRGK